jgi:hypothetical protein
MSSQPATTEKIMDTREKLIGARIGMLALADELQNISRACQVAGISRSHFYEIKSAFEKYADDRPWPRSRVRPPPSPECSLVPRAAPTPGPCQHGQLTRGGVRAR